MGEAIKTRFYDCMTLYNSEMYATPFLQSFLEAFEGLDCNEIELIDENVVKEMQPHLNADGVSVKKATGFKIVHDLKDLMQSGKGLTTGRKRIEKGKKSIEYLLLAIHHLVLD